MREVETPQPKQLSTGLKPRHIYMMALGGAIGAGYFQGSAKSISEAGPSVILAYLLGGIILFIVMQAMARLTIQNPRAATFRELVSPILGPFTGYVTGWMYWIDWVLVMGAEMVASASFLSYWFPNTPLWILALVMAIILTVLNLAKVSLYGETEYWLAAVKIGAILVFIVGGIVLILTRAHHVHPEWHANLTEHGGIFPHGFTGFVSSLLVVMFSYGGTEMIGMTIGETDNPDRVIPRAAKQVILRILIFYIVPLVLILGLVPWNDLGSQVSPFVRVFSTIGIPFAGNIMNAVLLLATFSAANAGMYAASRMLFSQAEAGLAPRVFAKLSRKQVPVNAALAGTSFLYIGVIVALFAGKNAFNDLMVVPSYSVLLVWFVLTAAFVRSVKDASHTSLRVSSVLAMVILIAIFVGVVLTNPLQGTILSVAVILLLALSYRFTRR